MNITAIYDKTITPAVRNDAGDVIGYKPTTHHYTFGSVGSELSGGFYIRVGSEIPPYIKATSKEQTITITLPPADATIKINKESL